MNHPRFRIFFSLVVLAVSLLAIPGCDQRPEDSEKNLIYRLKWLYNISVVGDLYCLEKRLFVQEGLQVTIKPGGPERDAITELETGRAHFGVASADQVIKAVAKGSPVVVLAQLFQVNPLQWIHRAGQGPLLSPDTWKGKVIGITYGGNDETIMRAMLEKNGVKENQVTFFSVRYDYTPFYQGKVDLWPVYQNAEGIIISDKLGRNGEKVAFLNPSRFGIHFVANSVVTTRQMVRERPEAVDKFLHALVQGWQQALDPDQIDQAVAVVHRYDQDTPQPLIHRQLDATRVLMSPPAGKTFGWLDVAAWKQTANIMYEQKLIPAPVDVEKILLSVHTIGKK